MKTQSENLFEKYLQSQGIIEWTHEEFGEENKHPDYCVKFQGEELLFEVKEFKRDPKKPLPSGFIAIDPYREIRKKIEKARQKFKNYKEHPCSLVLYNIDVPLISQFLREPDTIMGAMLGDLGWTMPVNIERGEAAGDPVTSFQKRGKMIYDKTGEPQNATINALIMLARCYVGGARFELERAKREAELDRYLNDEELANLANELQAQGIDLNESVPRVIVYENPVATKPLRADIFIGPLDERFVREQGKIKRIFVGDEIKGLEEKFQELGFTREDLRRYGVL